MSRTLFALGIALAIVSPLSAGDLPKLKGAWKTSAKADVEMQLTFKGDIVEIKVKGKGFEGVTESDYKLKEANKKKLIELDAKGVSGIGFPGVIEYQLDGNVLTIDVPSDDRKGKYKLERVKK